MNTIYMDHHATTPVDPVVLETMIPYFNEHFGNPSSTTHEYGHIANRAVKNARQQIADLVGAEHSDEIIFTSGATESNNLALKGVIKKSKPGSRLITIATEHKAILDTCKALEKEGYGVDYCKIDSAGKVDLADLQQKITPETVLISIQIANSEIGTIQPVADIARIAKEHDLLFHTDAAQACGKLDLDVSRDNIDLLSLSAHKMYGPKGVGALYVKKGIRLDPLFHGGGHERGMRSGTLNVPGVVGFGAAAEIAKKDLVTEVPRLITLRDKLIAGIQDRLDYVQLNGHPSDRLANNVNFSFAFVEGESLILACKPFALSSGSACTSSSLQSSYVLKEIGVPDSMAHCSIRFGLGKSNTEGHIDLLIDTLVKQVTRLRDMSPLYDMAKEGIDIDSFQWSDHHH